MSDVQRRASSYDLCSVVEGYVEQIRLGELEGWIWDAGGAQPFLCVEVTGPADFYCRVTADNFRQDLQDAAKNSGHCGFKVSLPEHLSSAPADQFIVLLDGTGHRLRFVGDTTDKLIEDWLDRHGGSTRAKVLVQRNCYDILGRAPTLDELGDWIPLVSDKVASLSTLVRTIASLRRSEGDRLDSLGMEEIVRNVYLGILKREAEPRGIEIYSEALRSGMPLAAFIGELVGTPEFMTRIAHLPQSSNSPELRRLAAAMERAVMTLAIGAAAQNDRPAAGVAPAAQRQESPEVGLVAALPSHGPEAQPELASHGLHRASLDQAVTRP